MERDGHTGVPGVEPGEVVGAGELPGMGRHQPPRTSSAAQDHETEREKLLVLYNLWLERCRLAQDPMERLVLNICARELREVLYADA